MNPVEAEHFHAVRFYQDATSLADLVCTFLAQGLRSQEPALIVATPEHVQPFTACFAQKGVDVHAVMASGALTVLDAEATLATFMRDGMPDKALFRATIGSVLNTIAEWHAGARIRAYGEMVDVLWKRDQTTAAIRLEMLWNDLARSHRFGLLCAYSMGHFYKDAATDDICSHHSHVITETGEPTALS